MLCFLVSFEHQIFYGCNYIAVNPTNLQTMSWSEQNLLRCIDIYLENNGIDVSAIVNAFGEVNYQIYFVATWLCHLP